jgi:hypothetical protein
VDALHELCKLWGAAAAVTSLAAEARFSKAKMPAARHFADTDMGSTRELS